MPPALRARAGTALAAAVATLAAAARLYFKASSGAETKHLLDEEQREPLLQHRPAPADRRVNGEQPRLRRGSQQRDPRRGDQLQEPLPQAKVHIFDPNTAGPGWRTSSGTRTARWRPARARREGRRGGGARGGRRAALRGRVRAGRGGADPAARGRAVRPARRGQRGPAGARPRQDAVRDDRRDLALHGAGRDERRLAALAPRGGRRRGDPIAALTVRVRQIADLVAGGLITQQIAERLHLSRKTVEAHISRAFAKLGVQSRVALTRRMTVGPQADSEA